jgi:hypothetical protein
MWSEIDRRVTAALLAVCCGLLAPIVAEEVLAHQFGLAGPPVFYGFVTVAAAAAVALWYASRASVRFVPLYLILSVGSAVVMFVYMFSQTQA